MTARRARARRFKTGPNPPTGSDGQAAASAGHDPLIQNRPNLPAASADQNRPNPPAGSAGPPSLCEPLREVILAALERGLSRQRIWQNLKTEHGFGGGYDSVKRFCRRLTQATPLPFRRMVCEPGAEAQVDFGTAAPGFSKGWAFFPPGGVFPPSKFFSKTSGFRRTSRYGRPRITLTAITGRGWTRPGDGAVSLGDTRHVTIGGQGGVRAHACAECFSNKGIQG